jgi:hypothetical protein
MGPQSGHNVKINLTETSKGTPISAGMISSGYIARAASMHTVAGNDTGLFTKYLRTMETAAR